MGAGVDRAPTFTYLTNRLNNMVPAPALANDRLNATFAALADPTRRAILARLASGEASVTELAAPFDMSMPAVSKRLKVLERAGLIARGREAQWRPCRLEAAEECCRLGGLSARRISTFDTRDQEQGEAACWQQTKEAALIPAPGSRN